MLYDKFFFPTLSRRVGWYFRWSSNSQALIGRTDSPSTIYLARARFSLTVHACFDTVFTPDYTGILFCLLYIFICIFHRVCINSDSRPILPRLNRQTHDKTLTLHTHSAHNSPKNTQTNKNIYITHWHCCARWVFSVVSGFFSFLHKLIHLVIDMFQDAIETKPIIVSIILFCCGRCRSRRRRRCFRCRCMVQLLVLLLCFCVAFAAI